VNVIVGIKTKLSLDEAQKLFEGIEHLIPTTSGVMDTTYLSSKYVLKKYEREVDVLADAKNLAQMHQAGLHVPCYLQTNSGWHLYTRLEGSMPSHVQHYHIQSLARFLSKLHTLKIKSECEYFQSYDIPSKLQFVKKNFFLYYKKLEHLGGVTLPCEGFIHGDLFKDNALFDGRKIAVIDFIDSGCGSFAFDCAVALIGFDSRKLHKKLFVRTYNQHAKRKLKADELESMMVVAKHFFALLRILHYSTDTIPFRAKIHPLLKEFL